MSDLSRALGLDRNPVALSALNSVGQSLAVSAGQAVLDKDNIPINLAQFVPTVPAVPIAPAPEQTGLRLDPTPQHNEAQNNGLKTVFHALIEGIDPTGLNVAQYNAAIEARLDAWVDSIS